MKIEKEMKGEDIFSTVFELNDHFKKARKYEKNGDTREKIEKYEIPYATKVQELLTVALLNVTTKSLEESLIYDQLEKYSKKGTAKIQELTEELILGLKDNANVYETKLNECKQLFKKSQSGGGSSSRSGGGGATMNEDVASTQSLRRGRGPLVAPSPEERNMKTYSTMQQRLKQTRVRLDNIIGLDNESFSELYCCVGISGTFFFWYQKHAVRAGS